MVQSVLNNWYTFQQHIIQTIQKLHKPTTCKNKGNNPPPNDGGLLSDSPLIPTIHQQRGLRKAAVGLDRRQRKLKKTFNLHRLSKKANRNNQENNDIIKCTRNVLPSPAELYHEMGSLIEHNVDGVAVFFAYYFLLVMSTGVEPSQDAQCVHDYF